MLMRCWQEASVLNIESNELYEVCPHLTARSRFSNARLNYIFDKASQTPETVDKKLV